MPNKLKFGANSILLIRSLPNGDEGIARRTAEQLAYESEVYGGMPVESCFVASFLEFERKITQVADRYANEGVNPLIHVDAHGDKTGLQFADGGRVSWVRLVECLTPLNGALRMNLVLTLGVCEGAAAILGLQALWRAPFVLLLAPVRRIQAKEVEAWTSRLYRSILKNEGYGDAVRAADSELESTSWFAKYSFRELFELAVDGYLTEHCHRAALRARAARLLRALRKTNQLNHLGHQVSYFVSLAKPTQEEIRSMWEGFCWHDLGADVRAKTPYKSIPEQAFKRRLSKGKSRRREIRKARIGDHMYGCLLSYTKSLTEEQVMQGFRAHPYSRPR